MVTLLAYDEILLKHRTDTHPEQPERLTRAVDRLKKQGLWDRLLITNQRVNPEPWIRTIHSTDYIQRVEAACKSNFPFIDSPENVVSPDSYMVACQSVSIALSACDRLLAGQADNGFCLLRPPGHHAEYNRSMGFCLFNNIAIAARYLQMHHKLRKILILDWDAHHGNGTQHSFEQDDTVFFCSLHQHPSTLYPGTGWPDEVGLGAGKGFTLNLPLEPGAGDEDCLELFNNHFLPLAQKFDPDFVLISAGFDGHKLDTLSQLNLTENAYGIMTEKMRKFAEKHCQGRLLSLLEGGYHLEALSECVARHLEALLA